MEADPSCRVGPGTITQVTRDRKPFGGELRAYLVLTSGFQPELEATVALPPGKNPVVRYGLERALLAGSSHPHPGRPRWGKPGCDLSFVFLQLPFDNGLITAFPR